MWKLFSILNWRFYSKRKLKMRTHLHLVLINRKLAMKFDILMKFHTHWHKSNWYIFKFSLSLILFNFDLKFIYNFFLLPSQLSFFLNLRMHSKNHTKTLFNWNLSFQKYFPFHLWLCSLIRFKNFFELSANTQETIIFHECILYMTLLSKLISTDIDSKLSTSDFANCLISALHNDIYIQFLYGSFLGIFL